MRGTEGEPVAIDAAQLLRPLLAGVEQPAALSVAAGRFVAEPCPGAAPAIDAASTAAWIGQVMAEREAAPMDRDAGPGPSVCRSPT